jgi:hypothetical protein
MSEAMLFLSSFGLMRGLLKAGSTPDHYRAARIVLKDFVQGKIVFCQAPPNVDQNEFCGFETKCDEDIIADRDLALDETFPELRLSSGVHMRGKRQIAINGNAVGTVSSSKKHGNAKKREKIRRKFNDSPYA